MKKLYLSSIILIGFLATGTVAKAASPTYGPAGSALLTPNGGWYSGQFIGGTHTNETYTGGTYTGGNIDQQLVTVPGGSTKTLENTLAQVLSPAWAAPTFQASILGGVVADTGVDQTANINAALALVPATGGKLLLPCGVNLISGTVLVAGQAVTLGSADNAGCAHLTATTAFQTGDMVRITGNYSGVEGLTTDMQFTPAQIADNITPFRTSGYNIDLQNGYGFVRQTISRYCFVCVEMGVTGGAAWVSDNTMEYIADGTANPGSGAIDVTNAGIGPENWIERNYMFVNIPSSVVYIPSFAWRYRNAGAVHSTDNDTSQAMDAMLINPGNNQTVQAVISTGDVLDGVHNSCLNIKPTGSGYVFHVNITNPWCTAVTTTSNGILIDGSAATPPANQSASIMDVKWIGGLIASISGQNGIGFSVVDSNSIDTVLADATIAGWSIGAQAGTNAGHLSFVDNAIGEYSPFAGTATNKTNTVGINAAAGTGDWIKISGNKLFNNTAIQLQFLPTAVHNRVYDNTGDTRVGTGPVTPTASPWSFTAGPSDTDLYLLGGTVSTVSVDSVNICTASPCHVSLTPYKTAIVTYSSVPTAAQTVH